MPESIPQEFTPIHLPAPEERAPVFVADGLAAYEVTGQEDPVATFTLHERGRRIVIRPCWLTGLYRVQNLSLHGGAHHVMAGLTHAEAVAYALRLAGRCLDPKDPQ